MTREECRAEIFQQYKDYISRYTWHDLDEIFMRYEKSAQAMKYSRPLY